MTLVFRNIFLREGVGAKIPLLLPQYDGAG